MVRRGYRDIKDPRYGLRIAASVPGMAKAPAPAPETPGTAVKVPPGKWVELLAAPEELKKWFNDDGVAADKAQNVKMEHGILILTETVGIMYPVHGSDMIVSSKVRLMSGISAGVRLRQGKHGLYSAWYNGKSSFGIGKIIRSGDEGKFKWKELKRVETEKSYKNEIIRMMFSAVGDTLTLYVDGAKILEVQDSSHKAGMPGVNVYGKANAGFKNIRVMIPAGSTRPREPVGGAADAIRIEAESMKILEPKAGRAPAVQNMAAWQAGKWSGGSQMFWFRAQPEMHMTLGFRVDKAGTYKLSAIFTRAPDYGIAEVHLDDKYIGKFNGYGPRVINAPPVNLGAHKLSAGKHRLRVNMVGKDPKSRGTRFGIDCIELTPVKE
jgi:hypothetical protein